MRSVMSFIVGTTRLFDRKKHQRANDTKIGIEFLLKKENVNENKNKIKKGKRL